MNRLLAYRAVMPRAVLVEHVRRLVGLRISVCTCCGCSGIVVEAGAVAGFTARMPILVQAVQMINEPPSSESNSGTSARSPVPMAPGGFDPWEAQGRLHGALAFEAMPQKAGRIPPLDHGPSGHFGSADDRGSRRRSEDGRSQREFDTALQLIRFAGIRCSHQPRPGIEAYPSHRPLGRSAFRTYVDPLAHYSGTQLASGITQVLPDLTLGRIWPMVSCVIHWEGKSA